MKKDEIMLDLAKNGYKLTWRGTEYTAEAIEIFLETEKTATLKACKNVYPTIALRNNTHWRNVERAVRHAFYRSGNRTDGQTAFEFIKLCAMRIKTQGSVC